MTKSEKYQLVISALQKLETESFDGEGFNGP